MPFSLRHLTLFTLVISLAGCAGGDLQDDDPRDTGSQMEMGFPDAGDVRIDDAPSGDIDAPFTGDLPEIVQRGSAGLMLRGIVLAPDRVLDPGEVLIVGDGIVCVDVDCSGDPDAADATVVETHGVISPGLIDAHNHLPYNFLPEWVPPAGTTYANRYEWSDEPSYEDHIAPYANHRSSGSHYCPAARWGEFRAIIHATTTMQGQSFAQNCIEGGVRNADHKHGIHYDHLRTTIASPRDITDDDAQNYLESFQDPGEPVTRFAVHMAEGTSGNHIDEEFASFAGRDPRPNRHNGVSLLYNGTSILIHSIALTDDELVEARDTDSKIVWSPSSNIALYGETTDIARILDLGITTGLGPDWTLSGEDHMLAEMDFALNYGEAEGIPALTPRKIWEMATLDGAKVVGLADHIGRIEEGYRADIAVFTPSGSSSNPYREIIGSGAGNVALVVIGGEVYLGDAHLEDALARNDFCETVDACGVSKFVCAEEPGLDDGGGIDDQETKLFNILEGIGYPSDEQYGRGEDLLPLVGCD